MPSESVVMRWLTRLANSVYRVPRAYFYAHLILAALSVWVTLQFLEFSTSRNDLVDTTKSYHSNYLSFKREFKAQDELVAVIESEDLEKNRQFVERLGAKLEKETNVFSDVFYKGDLTMLGPKALLFLPEDTLAELKTTLAGYRPFLQQFARASNLVSLFNLVNRQFYSAASGTNAETDALLRALPALERIVQQAADSLRRPGSPPSPGINALFGGGPAAEREIYITFDVTPLLRDEEIRNVRALAQQLRDAPTPELQYFRRELAPRTQEMLSAYRSGKEVPLRLRRRLLDELNQILQRRPLTELEVFASYRAASTNDAAAASPGLPEASGRLNRRILDAVVGGETVTPLSEGWFYLVSARARSEELNEEAVRRFRELLRETRLEVPGVNADLTGEPVLEIDEMAQSQKDTTLATIVSLAIVAAIFIFGYNETGRPLKACVCLVVGLAMTMGFTTIAIGHLNILTITFAPMLIGLAIDFGVHLITRYEEELRRGETRRVALLRGMVNTGLGIFTGAFTTAGAFLAMAITEFKGVREMGIISGGGLLICLVPMMTLLPVLLLKGKQNVIDHLLSPEADRRARFERLWLERPVIVTCLTVILTAAALTQFPKVYFDYNLLNMQTRGLPAVVFEKKLIDSASKSVLYGAVIANSLPEAVDLERRLTNLAVVASVDSMGRLLSEDQQRKLELIGAIKQEIAPIRFVPLDLAPVKTAELNQTLWSFDGYLGAALEEIHQAREKELAGQVESLQRAVRSLGQGLKLQSGPPTTAKLTSFQQALFRDIHRTFATLREQDDRSRITAADLPPALRNRFIGASGKYLLQVYPKHNVWERTNQAAFVTAVREVAPQVTGTPIQLFEYTTLLKDSYIEAAWYSLGAIVILVWLHFRSLVNLVLALVPVVVGAIWMVGLMGWFGIPFNPANIMTLPLVIGIGVTNGIHILNRFAEERSPGILAKSTGKAVLVSGLTTIAGFGSLILAQHQGIQSLGYLMSIGVATCMLAALTFLPALLQLLMRAGWTQKKTQWR